MFEMIGMMKMVNLKDDDELLDDLLNDEGEGEENEGGIESSSTQQAFNEAQENLSSADHGQPTTYVEIPENVDTSKHVVDWKTIHTWIDSQRDVRDDFTDVDDDYRKFRKQSLERSKLHGQRV